MMYDAADNQAGLGGQQATALFLEAIQGAATIALKGLLERNGGTNEPAKCHVLLLMSRRPRRILGSRQDESLSCQVSSNSNTLKLPERGAASLRRPSSVRRYTKRSHPMSTAMAPAVPNVQKVFAVSVMKLL